MDKLLSASDISRETGLSYTIIYRLMLCGAYPRSRSFQSTKVYESEWREFLKANPDALTKEGRTRLFKEAKKNSVAISYLGVRLLWLQTYKPKYDKTHDKKVIEYMYKRIKEDGVRESEMTEFCYSSDDVPSSLYMALYREGFIKQHDLDLDNPKNKHLFIPL